MTTTLAAMNGRHQRKQLSDQLNRLDDIIDTLADGLPEAVGDAVRIGVQSALQQILLDALSNPETVALFRAALAPPAPAPVAPPPEYAVAAEPAEPPESFLARCRRKFRIRSESLKVTAARGVETAATAVRETRGFVSRTAERVRAFHRGLNIAWQLKKAALIGLAVGAAVVVVALASHPLAAVLSGVGAATSAFALQVGLWFRKTARGMIA